MTTKELINLIENTPNFNFIGRCCSVLQINALNAAILYLESLGIKLNGYILRQESSTLTKKTFENNYFIKRKEVKLIDLSPDDNLSYSNMKEKVDVFRYAIRNKSKQSLKHAIFFVGANLIHQIYYACLKVYRNDRKVIYVEIDDGLENYLNRHKEFLILDLNKRRGKKIINVFLHRIISDFSYYILEFIVKNNKNYICALLLLKENGVVKKKNYKILPFYHKILQYNSKDIDYKEISIIEGKALLVGNGVDDIKKIEKIVTALRLNNCNVVYKPHPRDKNTEVYRKIGCELFVNMDKSLETIIEKTIIKPKLIIGDYSTCLLTAKALFGIPTVSYVNIMKNISKREIFGGLDSLFSQTFYQYIAIPETLIEFQNFISKNI